MAHGASELCAAIAAATVLPAIQGLDEERARFYGDLVYNALNDAARRALEAMMKGYEYQSDFAKSGLTVLHAITSTTSNGAAIEPEIKRMDEPFRSVRDAR